jgi:hypothetical protein
MEKLLAAGSAFFVCRESATGAHFIGGWVGPKAGQGTLENRNISITVRNQTLFPQSYSQ